MQCLSTALPLPRFPYQHLDTAAVCSVFWDRAQRPSPPLPAEERADAMLVQTPFWKASSAAGRYFIGDGGWKPSWSRAPCFCCSQHNLHSGHKSAFFHWCSSKNPLDYSQNWELSCAPPLLLLATLIRMFKLFRQMFRHISSCSSEVSVLQ